MSDHINLFSQRIFKEHPVFNWSLQNGENDFVYVDQSGCPEENESGAYSVALGCPPIYRFRWPEDCDNFEILNGSGAVRYDVDNSSNADSWGRDRIPMVVGSNGTTVVNNNTPELEANLFLTASGQSDTFVFEFWMRVVGQGRDRIKILQSKYNSDYGLWLKGTVLTFVYGRTFCSYDVQVVDVPIYVSLYTHPTGIGLVVNGEPVAFSEFENPEENHLWPEDDEGGSTSPEQGFDICFVENDDVFLEVDAPSLFGYAQDAEISKRRYVWGQGAGDIQSINNSFDGQSAFANFNSAELPGHAAYPLNYRWESGAKDNLVVRQDKLSFRHPKLPVHSFVDPGPVSRTKYDWFINMDQGDSFGPYESDQGQVFTTFDLVGSFVDDPVSMFFKGTDFGVSITSVFFPGYEVYITPETVYWSLDRSGTTDQSVETKYFFPEGEQQSSYDNFIFYFENFDPDVDYAIWSMLQQPEGLKVTISKGIIDSLGFGSRTQDKYDDYNELGTVGRLWQPHPVQFPDAYASRPSYLWKGSREFGFFYEDVELRGYWEDYIPYNTLAAVDESGEFDIDYLQFNMSHLGGYTGWIEAKLKWANTVGVAPSKGDHEGTLFIDSAENHTAIPSKDESGDPYGSVLRLYLSLETDGYFANPIQLNKLSVSTYHGDIVKTKGLSIDKHDGKFLYDIDSMPFLTLGEHSGFCSDQPFDVLVGDVESVGAIQFFVRIPEIPASSDPLTLASFSGNSVTITNNELTSSGGKLVVNGEEVDSKSVQANEWHCVALVFDNAVDESDGSITMASGYNWRDIFHFDNIGYFLNTSNMVQTMKNVWQAYTMSESLEFTSYQPMELIQNDIAAYPGIAWQQTDIEPL